MLHPTTILRLLIGRSAERVCDRRRAATRGRFTPLESRCLLSHAPAPIESALDWIELHGPAWVDELPRWSVGQGEPGFELPGKPGGPPPQLGWNLELEPPGLDPPVDGELGGYMDMDLNAPASSTGPVEATATPLVGDTADQEVRQVRDVLSSLRFTPAALALPSGSQPDDVQRLAAHEQLFADSEVALHEPVEAEPDAEGGMIELTPAAWDDEPLLAQPEMQAWLDEPVAMDNAYGRFQAFEVSTTEEPLLPSELISPQSVSPSDAPPADADDARAAPAAAQTPAHGAPRVELPSAAQLVPESAAIDPSVETSDETPSHSDDVQPAARVDDWGVSAPRHGLTAAIAAVALAARATRSSAARGASAIRFQVTLRPPRGQGPRDDS